VQSADSPGLIRMANVIVTLKIMPESPDVELADLESKAKEEIADFTGETETKVEIEPIAFGLKALNIFFVMDENKGTTDFLESKITEIDGVNSVEVTDVRRAVG